MTISVLFEGGPMEAMRGRANSLPVLMVFFDERQRQVFLYRKINETVYVFLPVESKTLTDKYDESFKRLGGIKTIERWEDR